MAIERDGDRSAESLGKDLRVQLEHFEGTLRVWEEIVANLNEWTVDDLKKLSGFGPVLAERVTTHRERNGPFRTVQDLMDVNGIGAVKLAALRDAVAGEATPTRGRSTTRYQRQTAHLPALGETARDASASVARLRVDNGRRSLRFRQSANSGRSAKRANTR